MKIGRKLGSIVFIWSGQMYLDFDSCPNDAWAVSLVLIMQQTRRPMFDLGNTAAIRCCPMDGYSERLEHRVF
jgi:hypothetical protein